MDKVHALTCLKNFIQLDNIPVKSEGVQQNASDSRPPPKKKQQPWLLLFFLAHGWFNCFAISSSSLKCPGSCCFREACSISKSIHQATKSSSLLIWMDFKARCSPLLLFFSWLNSLPCHEIMINISIYIYINIR